MDTITKEPPHCPTCDCATGRTADLLWIGAFRYYLGRRTYAVSDFCAALIASWAALSSHLQRLIERELDEEIRRDTECRRQGLGAVLGDTCDRKEWERVFQHIQAAKQAGDAAIAQAQDA